MVKKDTTLSIEDKFDEVRQLILVGKEKGYLLYDEVSDLLPADLTASPEDLEELFAAFGAAGRIAARTRTGRRCRRRSAG